MCESKNHTTPPVSTGGSFFNIERIIKTGIFGLIYNNVHKV